MTKSFVMGLCVAVLAAVGQADAAEGVIPASTLQAMGLGNAVIVSDAAAMEVRGMGYESKSKKHISYGSTASGGSYASAGTGGYKGGADAGTKNKYNSAGKYSAGGETFSEAGYTVSDTLSVEIDGVLKVETTTKSVSVYAGGYSSAWNF